MTKMTRIAAGMLVTLAALALAAPASAAKHHRRAHSEAYSETGPLSMSGTMVPAASSHRSRALDICRPVVIKRRAMFSAVWR